uniref:Secreted protein n=1 Tax=Steinernema glaseri TaxID=37863 RepID=A0A1I7YVN5_9BILA
MVRTSKISLFLLFLAEDRNNIFGGSDDASGWNSTMNKSQMETKFFSWFFFLKNQKMKNQKYSSSCKTRKSLLWFSEVSLVA